MRELLSRRSLLGGAAMTVPLGTVGAANERRDDTGRSRVNRTQGEAADDRVQRAIGASWSFLRETATTDGFRHWDTAVRHGEYGGLRYTVYYALLLERLGTNEEAKDRCVSFLLEQRSPDGGWTDPVTNFGGRLLFESMAAPEYRDVIADVQSEIEERNQSLFPSEQQADSGVGLTGRFRMRLLYATMSDQYTFADLFPNELPLEIGRLLAFTRAFDGRTIAARENMSRPIYVGPLAAYFLIGAAARETPLEGDDAQLAAALESVLLSRRLTNGAWNTSTTTIFAAFALAERGYDSSADAIRHPVEWIADRRLDETGRVEIWRLPVWDTGLVVEALLESGMSTTEPLLRDAARWLYRARTPQLEADPVETILEREPAPYRRHHGSGWGYMPHVFSDWDDTALAISALSAFLDSPLEEQTAFLRDVQNRDGSWSAYTTNFEAFSSDDIAEEIRSELGDGLYRILFDHVPCPDVTGRALAALGTRGETVAESETVRDAVAYLEGARGENGLWLGVWAQGYTYGTAQVMSGLRQVGVDIEGRFDGAAGSLIDRQNADGGWGEDTRYDPARSSPGTIEYQRADSTPTQTGWALQALLSAGVSPTHDAVQDGVDYLLRTQRSDGSWDVHRVMYNYGGPGYSTVATTQAAALKALGRYATAV